MKRKINVIRWSLILLLVLIIASWGQIFLVDGADLGSLFTEKNAQYTRQFISGLFGAGEEVPAFKDPELWRKALLLSYETLIMSVIAIGIAAVGMLFTVVFAAKNLADGRLTLQKRWYNRPLYLVTRGIYVFSRSVPELLWAMLIVFMLKPGILPGALALGIHNLGILGKLCSEVIEDMKPSSAIALASAGAGKTQLLFYGIFPTVMNRFLTYILYRWEVIIRTSIVVGFVGAGGLGQAFKLAMSFFHYSEISLYLLCYILLVYLADLISNLSRRYIEK